MDPVKQYVTIGKLVKRLKKIYPDLTSSKLRFLESKGLLTPKRASNKYRIYFEEDIKKLNYILKMQKDFYMPLAVIKQKLKSVDLEKTTSDKEIFKESQLELGREYYPSEPKLVSLDEIKKKYKLSSSLLNDLLENGIIDWREENGKYIIDGEDIEIIKMVIELAKFGIKLKHLKLFENFATRHSSFIQQIILPLLKSSSKNSSKKAKKTLKKLEEYLCTFHSLLVKRENKRFLEKYK